MNLILIYFSIKYKGDFQKIFSALKNHEEINDEDLTNLKNKIDSREIEAITLLDDEYPNEFKRLFKPPFVLFYKGNIKLLKNEFKINLTGDKNNRDVEAYLNQSLPEVFKRYTWVTNLYKGLDQNINNEFIKNNKPRIYISANGVEKPYFANEIILDENSLIISEYPNGSNISKAKLKLRNRLVASLSSQMVIYSSEKDSGIMNLVSNFLEQGKEIYCFPGDFENEDDGNTTLIKQGANLITKIKDIY